MKRTIRTFFAKIPSPKSLHHAAKRWWNILVMKIMQPVMNANHQNKRNIEKLIIKLDGKKEQHLLKIESMLSEFYDAGILPKKSVLCVEIKQKFFCHSFLTELKNQG